MSLYSPRAYMTSASASSLVACAVWPSCQRNSRVRKNSFVALVSQRTMLHHWLILSGKSRQLRIHLLNSGVHYGFAGGTNRQFLFKRRISALSNPCDFWSEACKVLSFLFEERFRNKHGEINVAVSCGFDFLVDNFLDFFPNCIGVWANNHAAFNGCVICKFSFQNNLQRTIREKSSLFLTVTPVSDIEDSLLASVLCLQRYKTVTG